MLQLLQDHGICRMASTGETLDWHRVHCEPVARLLENLKEPPAARVIANHIEGWAAELIEEAAAARGRGPVLDRLAFRLSRRSMATALRERASHLRSHAAVSTRAAAFDPSVKL